MTSACSLPRRILSLYLPRLPTDRLARAAWGPSWRSSARRERAAPRVVYGKVKNALRLTAIDECAARRGLSVGLTLTDARARLPDLAVAEEDGRADRLLLEALADWCDRYTPLVALDPPDGLVLDISGCAHLFGGEASLLCDLVGRLDGQGFAATAAIAGTLGAAAALARFAPGTVVAPGGERAALGPLPVAGLRLEGETVDLMAQVGLRTISDLIGRPRAPLAARFGIAAVVRLDEALGHAGETVTPRRPPPALVAERRFAEALADGEAVFKVVFSLARTLSETLYARGEGARLLEVALFRVDGAVARTRIGTGRPLRDPALVVRLFRERLKGTESGIDAGFGFDLVRLSVLESGRDDPRQLDMTGSGEAHDSVDDLVDRLGARLGLANVSRFLPVDSHVPEAAVRLVPAACAGEQALTWPPDGAADDSEPPARPLRMFAPPEPIETLAEVPEGPPVRFRWRRVAYDVRLAEGPERIAPPWWRGECAPPRDYFRVEDTTGRRFWLFREGLYGEGAEAMPRWYLQGLFA